jgi:hypothetical protein
MQVGMASRDTACRNLWPVWQVNATTWQCKSADAKDNDFGQVAEESEGLARTQYFNPIPKFTGMCKKKWHVRSPLQAFVIRQASWSGMSVRQVAKQCQACLQSGKPVFGVGNASRHTHQAIHWGSLRKSGK